MYFGSMWKDYAVWQAAPWIAHRHRRDATRTRSSTTTSRAGRPSRCASRATCCSPSTSCAACSSSPPAASRTCSTTANERSRFMFNFGDGAVAGLLDEGRRPQRAARLLRAHGRLVLAAGEGAVGRQRRVAERRRPLPRRRRPGGDEGAGSTRSACRTSSPRREGALERSGATLDDVGYLCGIHMKRSMHDALARRARRRPRAPPTSTTPAT